MQPNCDSTNTHESGCLEVLNPKPQTLGVAGDEPGDGEAGPSCRNRASVAALGFEFLGTVCNQDFYLDQRIRASFRKWSIPRRSAVADLKGVAFSADYVEGVVFMRAASPVARNELC